MARLDRPGLATQIAALLADNTAGDITAADMRSLLTDVADSFLLTTEQGSGRNTVLQTAVAPSTTAGVAAVTLPADYAGYQFLDYVVFDGLAVNSQDDTVSATRLPTAVIAVAPTGTFFAYDTKENGDPQGLRWDATARTLTTDATTQRIIYAELLDGGPAGESAAAELADNSITPPKAQADTAARQKAWRERLGSASIDAGIELPTLSATNPGDLFLFTQDVASGLSWVDIADPSVTITAADAGDVAMHLGARLNWVRVGNILAANALRATVAANATSIGELQTEASTLAQSIAGEGTSREAGDDLQSVTVSSASSYQSTLNSQQGSPKPLLLVISAAISGSRDSTPYSYDAGDVLYVPPVSETPEYLFTLPQPSSGGGQTQSQVDARVRALVTDWAAQGNTDRLPEAKITESVLNDIAGNSGNIQTNSNLISGVTQTVQSLVTEVDTLHPKIGRLVPITPWIRNNEARTLRFAWFPLDAVSTTDTLRMSIGGVAHTPTVTEGYAATDVSGIVLAVPVNAANSATITRESNTTAGFVRVDLVMAQTNFHCYIPAVDPPPAGWRQITTAASPYTILPSDAEFRFEMQHTDTASPTANIRYVSVDFLRAQLTAGVMKEFGFAENRPEGGANFAHLEVTLNTSGRQLAAVIGGVGTGAWIINAVYAK